MKGKPMKKGAKIAIIVIIIVTALLVAMIVLSGGGEDSSSVKNTTKEQIATSKNSSKEEQVVFENDKLKLTFKKVYNESLIEGVCYFQLEAENRSDRTMTLLFEKASVNDHMVAILSGMPTTITAGKKATSINFFNNEAASISNASDVKSMEFTVSAVDENMNEITNTGAIKVIISN